MSANPEYADDTRIVVDVHVVGKILWVRSERSTAGERAKWLSLRNLLRPFALQPSCDWPDRAMVHLAAFRRTVDDMLLGRVIGERAHAFSGDFGLIRSD